jgi:tetratricopeptide (TPR) repeat protein
VWEPFILAAFIAYAQGDNLAFRAKLDELLALFQDTGDRRIYDFVQFPMGCWLLAEGDYTGAYQVFDGILTKSMEEKTWKLAAFTLSMLGSTMLLMKDYARANKYLESAVDRFEQTNDLYGLGDINRICSSRANGLPTSQKVIPGWIG